MNIINEILNNKMITLMVSIWIIIQIFKFIVDFIKNKRVDFKRLIGSGGMPSSHSAVVTCLATTVGMVDGFGSSQFALAVGFALVVMYDAAGVRRAAGRQARILNQLITSNKKINNNEKLKELLGHTPIEVAAGAIVGVLWALLML